ncbi:MAG: FtsX-like permease family protein, partial [Terriglobales bacterium]
AASQFLRHAVQSVAAVPGVRAVSLTDAPPLQISVSATEVLPPGMQPPPGKHGFDVDTTNVGANYFAAAGTHLLSGRDFTASDVTAKAHLVVLNETLARAFWPKGDAVGHTLLFPGNTDMPSAQIVGVAENGKYRSLGEQPRRYLYQLADIATPAMLIARVNGNPRAFQAPVARALQGLDPNLTRDNVQTIQTYMQVPLFSARFTGILLAGFGILALLLAVVGLYGVIAASVAQRTREYGIRMALGADAGALLKLVVGQGLRLALIGVGIGIVLAILLTRFMAFLLYGLSPLDPISYALAAALLVGVTVLACLLPARRATRVDPLRALRAD